MAKKNNMVTGFILTALTSLGVTAAYDYFRNKKLRTAMSDLFAESFQSESRGIASKKAAARRTLSDSIHEAAERTAGSSPEFRAYKKECE